MLDFLVILILGFMAIACSWRAKWRAVAATVDMRLWAHRIRVNGLLCGHDYVRPKSNELSDAIRAYADNDGLIDWTGCAHGPSYTKDS